jgi:hypothetical protein
MDLIWTYDGRVKIGKMSNENRRITLLNYYIFSIMTAKKLGHNTIIYTDIDSADYFKNLTNEIVVVDNYENSILWDYLKIKVLEERKGDFYLIDGDVILNRKLPKFIEDITFDTYEIGNWNTEYKNMVNLLTKMDIKNYIDIWDDLKKPVINCGILSIKNETNRLNYVYLWKKFNNWVNSNYQQNNLNVDELTMIGAQYLLTLMVENLNLSKNKLNNQMGENGTFHRHYFGLTKFYEKLVPSNHLIDFTKSKNLI